jgi:hypothetical protein
VDIAVVPFFFPRGRRADRRHADPAYAGTAR